MDCHSIAKGLSSYLDAEIPEPESRVIAMHLASCRECVAHMEELDTVRQAMRRVPQVAVPADLNLRLRIDASRVTCKRTRKTGFWSLFWMRLNHAMRPLMVPACGGFLSSVLLFSVFVDTLDWRLNLGNDIPLGLYTSVSVDETSPFQFTGRDLLLQLTVNEKGNVTDFEVPNGNLTHEDLRNIGNWLLFTSFNPATKYGQPTSGKVMVSFHRINVKG
jgi:predicted anti-sigma-YlaC factor YlaD